MADIEEGINAGMWVVGVTRTSNALGLTEEEAASLPAAELAAKEEAFAEVLRKAGAHYVLHSVADLPGLVPVIEARLKAAERPW